MPKWIYIYSGASQAAHTERHNVQDTIVALEEYILVVGGRSGFLLPPCISTLWRDAGCKRDRSDDERLLRIEIHTKEQKYDFVAGYAPTGDVQGRRDFFERAEEVRCRMRAGATHVWMGD